MIEVSYSEIRAGDVGRFTDDTIWVATGPFRPGGTLFGGEEWGSFPVHIPMRRNETLHLIPERSRIEGRLATPTQLIWRMEA